MFDVKNTTIRNFIENQLKKFRVRKFETKCCSKKLLNKHFVAGVLPIIKRVTSPSNYSTRLPNESRYPIDGWTRLETSYGLDSKLLE